MVSPHRSHGWPGGSIATVFNNETLRTITEVNGIGRLGRDSGGRGSSYSQSGDRGSVHGFAGILEDERKKTEEPKNISVKNTTYGRDGYPTAVYLLMRDYTYQIH